MSGQTPSQTVGPYFAYGLAAQQYHFPGVQVADGTIASEGTAGRIRVLGNVYDGAGAPIRDALIEVWQADAVGRYGAEGFKGFGRCGTGTHPDACFEFATIKPGRNGAAAPFITLLVFMRGLLSHVFTRAYFDDEAAANAADPVLNQVPAERRASLIAFLQKGEGLPTYRFDIRMQGERETVFFDV